MDPQDEGRPNGDGAARVALAMPETLVGEALARVLREAGFLVLGCYETPAALLEKIRRCRPDLVLLDPLIDEGNGNAKTLESVRRDSPSTRVAVVAGEVDA